MTGDLAARVRGAAGHISLNRPAAIHALTRGMCEDMTAALGRWRDDPAIATVIIDHAQGRGFCAGGDIALLRASALEDGGRSGRDFFLTEYRLNHLIHSYPKPVVAFMDGITMGGGVGISQPARFRVATPGTRFAMPETGIGMFPDVGGGWYLSRLPGRLGQFLALTGARLDGAECLWAGLATHYLPAEALDQAKDELAAGHDPDRVLAALAVSPPPARLAGHSDAIDRHFAYDRFEDVLASLEQDGGEWATGQRDALLARSPLACKIALRQLQASAELPDFAANMAMEYRLASRILTQPDFAEGVRALIVDKTGDPAWNPARPEQVGQALLDSMFAPLPPEEEWKPL